LTAEWYCQIRIIPGYTASGKNAPAPDGIFTSTLNYLLPVDNFSRINASLREGFSKQATQVHGTKILVAFSFYGYAGLVVVVCFGFVQFKMFQMPGSEG